MFNHEKFIKKLAFSVSVLSMLIAPTSVFASETYTLVNETSIKARIAITQRLLIQNGETAYFVNSNTRKSFCLLSNAD